jgi:RsiW-degrading membrane proteinase PrsW (M82 family)
MAVIVDHLQGVGALELTQSPGLLVGLAVVVPILQEAVKPLPALMLRSRPGFADGIDGLTLGIAAGLGFAVAQTLVNFSGVIGSLPFRVDPSAWIYPLITAAVLLPLLQATTAGAVAVALWRSSGAGARPWLVLSGIPVALIAHVAFALGSQLLSERGPGHVAVIVWQGLIVSAMIMVIRRLLLETMKLDAGRSAAV